MALQGVMLWLFVIWSDEIIKEMEDAEITIFHFMSMKI